VEQAFFSFTYNRTRGIQRFLCRTEEERITVYGVFDDEPGRGASLLLLTLFFRILLLS
jgi:hypothetical protein